MENINMTNMTQNTRVRFVCPQVADRILTVGVGGAFEGTGVSAFGFGPLSGFGAYLRISAVTPVPSFSASTHKAASAKDVAYLRTWSPPV